MKTIKKAAAFLLIIVILLPHGLTVLASGISKGKEETKTEKFVYPKKQKEPEESHEESEYTPEIDLPEVQENTDTYEEQYGEPVEVTEHTKVYQMDNTHFKTVLTSDKNTYEDASGKEVPVDNTLQPAVQRSRSLKTEKEYINKANEFKVRLPEKVTAKKGISITKDGTKLTLYPAEGEYANAGVKENAILYNDVFDGIDVQYTVEGFGLKEDIILRRQVEKNEFSYVFDADEIEAKLEDEKVKIYRWDKKEPVFELTAPVMTDANGQISSGVKLSLDKKQGQYLMTITADKDWLSAAERAYPVRIDPNIKIPSSKLDVVTTSTVHGTYQGLGYGYVGYITASMTGVPGAKDIGKSRMYFKINEDFKKLIPEEGKINTATLNVYQYGRYDSTTATFSCYRLEKDWNPSSLTWENSVDIKRQPSGEKSTSKAATGMHKFDIRQSVNDWSQGIAKNYGLMLMAVNEGDKGSVFYTPESSGTGGQVDFKPEYRPHIEINWEVPDPVPTTIPLNNTTITLRTMIETNMKGRLRFHGVFADGVAKPESYVSYSLNDSKKKYTGNVRASLSYKYPDSSGFDKAFPKYTTRYKDKLSNWQTVIPFTEPKYNDLYYINAYAAKDGEKGKTVQSHKFTIYKVTQFDTLPKIARYYGIPLSQIMFDNRVQDMLLIENNTLFIRNPKKNANKPYNPPPLSNGDKRKIDSLLMGRGLHCEFGFEPINLNTGNFYMNQTDAELPDYSDSFAMERTYNSKGADRNSVFGRGWQFAYSEQLSMKEDGSIIYGRGDGSSIYFTPDDKGGYTVPDGYYYKLKKIKTGQKEFEFEDEKIKYNVYEYEIRDSEQTVRRFDCYGMLKKITDKNGFDITLSYDKNYNLSKITAASGVSYGVTCQEDGMITKITLPDGKALTYSYDSDNNLVSYKNALGIVTKYAYDSDHRMTAWYDGTNTRMVQNTYDDEGRVTKQVDANGKTSKLSYSKNATTTTDANGRKTVYSYDSAFRTTKITYPDNTTTVRTYKDGNLAGETDQAGHLTAFSYDENGNCLTETRYDGAKKSYTYNSKNQMTSETDFDGTKTEYSYDSNNNLIKETKGGVRQKSYTYNTKHQVISETDANGNKTVYTYNKALPATVKNAKGQVTTYTYNQYGQETSIKDASGNVTRYMYDAGGRKTGEQLPDGAYTSYAYDKAGNLISTTDAQKQKTEFTYDKNGKLLTLKDPRGKTYKYTYDAVGNQTSKTDPEGNKTSCTYDSMNRKTSETDKDGNKKQFSYDKLGNCVTRTEPGGNKVSFEYDHRFGLVTRKTDALNQSEEKKYSKAGLLLEEIRKDGKSTSYAYDKFGNLLSMTEPGGIKTTYEYDLNGNRIRMTDSEGGVYLYKYDELGRLTERSMPDSTKITSKYDLSGNLISETDGLGRETVYTYDAAGRVTGKTDPEGNKTAYEYDALGQQTALVDEEGNKSENRYNAIGQITTFIDKNGGVTTYEYDSSDRLISKSDALKGKTSYQYDGAGNPIQVTDPEGRTYKLAYDKSGNNTAITLPDQTVRRYEYDKLGRMTKETDSEGLITQYKYNKQGAVTKVWDNAGNSSEFEYDEAGNTVKETDALQQSTVYTYDKLNRITSVTKPDGNKTSYEYDSMGRVNAVTDPEGKITKYTYDKAGQLISEIDDNLREKQYIYDHLGRLTKETNPLGETSAYSYDKIGNLTSVTDGAGNKQSFRYDSMGNVLEETDANGHTTSYTYDANNQVIKVVTPEDGEEEFLYDKAGNLIKYKDAEEGITSYEYDSMNHVKKMTTPNGGNYVYKYDGHGVNTSTLDPLGNETKMEADLMGQVTSRHLPNGAEYSYKYDLIGRLEKINGPEGKSVSYEYDERGDLISEEDQSGRKVTYTYDSMHRILSTTNALDQKTSYSYDKQGNMNSVVTPLGHRTSFQYDSLDRIEEQTDPSGKVTKLKYDMSGNIKEMIEKGGKLERSTKYSYDAAGNLLEEVNPLEQKTQYAYDKMDRLTAVTDARGNTVSYRYNKNGNVTEVQTADGAIRKMEYDKNGNMIALQDGEGRKSTYEYDLLDRITSVAEKSESGGEDVITSYSYDSVGNLTSQTDGNGNTVSYEYNLSGQMLKRTNAMGESESCEYDPDGRLSKLERPDGNTLRYDYNKLDELLAVTYGEEEKKEEDSISGDVLYAYDTEGRRISMKDLTGESSYEYDEQGRITAVRSPDGNVIAYAYDEFGNLSSLTYPDGKKVSYEYDLLDRLIKVTDRNGLETKYDYDDSGNLIKIIRPNGSVSKLTYNVMDQVEKVVNKDAQEEEASSYTYEYDLSGKIIKERAVQGEKETVRRYSYNERGELAASITGEEEEEEILRYAYDKAGNRISITRSQKNLEEKLKENIYDSANRLIVSTDSVKGKTTYEYDKNGNLVRELGPDETVKTYEYDTENRLKAVMEQGTLLMSALYDGDGNRIFTVNRKSGKESEETPGHEDFHKIGTNESPVFSPNTAVPSINGGKAGKDGKSLNNHLYQDYGMEKSEESGFWLGVWHAVIEFIAPNPVPYKEWINENYNPVSYRFYQSFHKECTADEEGIAEQQEQIEEPQEEELPEGFVSTHSEDIYNTVMIPYGVTEKERDDYVLTSYVNDVNRENAQVLMEYGTDGFVSNTYDFGTDRNSITHYGQTEYYAYDGRGSVANLFDSEGSAAVSYSYDVFGKAETEGETSNKYDYNSEYTDINTGFQYLRARYYNPENGSFITQDDYLGDLLEPLSQNQYTYVENDPINYQDPSGHKKKPSAADYIGGIAGAVVGMMIGGGAGKVVNKAVSHGVSTTIKKAAPRIRRKYEADKLRKKGYVPLVPWANVLSDDAYNQQLLKDQKYYETGMNNRYAAGVMKKAEAMVYKNFCEKAEKAKDKKSKKKVVDYGKIIDDQDDKSIKSKDFGILGDVGNNGCGAVAVYNALILMGEKVTFDEILKEFNKFGGMGSTVAGGLLGANPFLIGSFLERRGYTTKWVSPGMAKKGADSYIVLYGYAVGAHYQAAQYTKEGIELYNRLDNISSFKEFANREGNILTYVLEIRRKK